MTPAPIDRIAEVALSAMREAGDALVEGALADVLNARDAATASSIAAVREAHRDALYALEDAVQARGAIEVSCNEIVLALIGVLEEAGR